MIRIGQRLKDDRIAKGLSLEDVSRATKIRVSFLTAIEKGEYAKLPSSSYAVGFVQNYAEFLGLPKKEITALFRREFDGEKIYKVLPEGFIKEEQLARRSFKIHQAIVPVVGFLLLLVVFLLYQYRAAFLNPPLHITLPKEGAEASSSEIVVMGSTDPNVTLTVNAMPVAIEDDGKFSKNVTIFPGSSVITIRAINKFGKETVVQRSVNLSSKTKR